MEERIGEAFAFEEQLTVLGKKLLPMELAPDFVLDYVDLIDMTVHQTRLTDSSGVIRVLSVVNSLDMPVCRFQTLRWEEMRLLLPPDICLYTISMDLPYAQARWQIAEAVVHQTLSAHRSDQFGLAYGVLLKEWRLLQRAIFVINRDDYVIHAQYMADQQGWPDFQLTLDVISKIS